MTTLCPSSGTSKSLSGARTLSASPNSASLSTSPTSGYTSPNSPRTAATSTKPGIPSNDEVEAVIKQATSTRPTPDGRPPPGKDTRTQLFTGNLPYRVRWQDLKDLFRRAGTVLRTDVSLSPDNRSRGYGTVLLASAEDAGRAVDMFNGYNWQGRVLEVRLDRLGNFLGAELDANAGPMMPVLPLGANVNGLNANMNVLSAAALNGLHVPAPQSAISLIAQQQTGNGQDFSSSPIPTSAISSLSAALSSTLTSGSPLNALNSNPNSLQQHQQQQQQEKEREELLMSQAETTIPRGLDPFFGTLGRGLSIDERPRSSLGMRSLFVGNLPFHCQWQDLKDLFRQAGTILRADVSLGADGRSRGFGTVTYANEVDAERAVAMFNGFDYNGRVLKVHYDKFSAQSPLPPNFSSTLATPVQQAAMSTQAALFQAAQLQQLVNGQLFGSLNGAGPENNSNNEPASEFFNGRGAHAQSHPIGVTTQSLHDSLQIPFQRRPSTASANGDEQRANFISSNITDSSPSPFSHNLLGTSPSLAERRQKVPPPIGSSQSTLSRPGSQSGSGSGLALGATVSAIGSGANAPSCSAPESPTKSKRPTGQSLPAPSATVPIATPEEGSSGVSRRPAMPSSVPTLSSTVPGASASALTSTSTSASHSHSSSVTSSTSPRSSHPAHPGPISLPPPPSVSAFPMYSPHHHPLSPPPGHPMSPPGAVYAGYPAYGPMSPMHTYPLPVHMHPHNMTPHGLPPITPSMPSFSFVPQPSPSVPAAGGSNAIPPTPAEGGPMAPPEGYPSSGMTPSDSSMVMGMMPMMSPPLHLPRHVFQPFTPGAALSPGGYYVPPNGTPGRGSYLNPAVGSPVLVHPPFGFPHPGSQPGSPYGLYGNGMPYGEEPNGYFPPVIAPHAQQQRHDGYFPPVSALGSSGLANEILKDGSSMNVNGLKPVHERNDSGTSSENATGDDTDAERARSSSSGATSWRSSEDNTSGSTGAGMKIEGLAQDMSSLQLGSAMEGTGVSYASVVAIPASTNLQKGTQVQRTESAASADDANGYPHGVRHSSEGLERPTGLQKTHSDETGVQIRMGGEPVGMASEC